MVSNKVTAFLAASAFCCVSAIGYAGDSYQIMEDNDLWKDDDLNKKSNLTEEMFNAIIDAGLQLYEPVAREHNETLTIARRWDDPTVNASCMRLFGVTINMYGGLARRDEITPEGFALVMCHELGHAYGGLPYLQSWLSISAEGQSDYYGSKECLAKVLPLVEDFGYQPDDYIDSACAERYDPDSGEYALCVRKMHGAYSLGTLLSVVKEEPQPEFDTPDPTVVDETELSYPASIQCRLDTYHNGILGMDRPVCWFKN